MTSVAEYITCPQCGNELAYSEYQTRTFEDSARCFICGYRAWTRTLIDRQKSAADPEGRLFFKKCRDGGIIQRFYERKGYGACSPYSMNGAGVLYYFSKPLPREAHEEFRSIIAEGPSGDHDLRQDLSYLTCWNEDLGRAGLIAGTAPDTASIEHTPPPTVQWPCRRRTSKRTIPSSI